MKRTFLALITLAATSAAAQQTSPQVMVGHPIAPRTPNPPTLPLRRVVGPTVAPGRSPANVRYVPAPYPFYAWQQPYAQQPYVPRQDVSVSVTNIVQAPPPVTYIVQATGAQAMGPLAGLPLWDPEADIAASQRNAQAVAKFDPDRADRVATADPDDARSLESIIGALYDVLSGPRGTPRNWDRFRGLFADGGRLIATRSENGAPARPTVMTPDDYVAAAAPVLERGVFQREVSRSVERFGAIAHVFSTYECRRMSGDPRPYQRGINSIQLMNDGTRWWIMSVSWDAERPDNPIPSRYLPSR